MAAPQMFINLRPKRSVLQRTRARQELPKVALYMGELVGQNQRRVLGPEGDEHVLTDKILASNYKLASGAKSKELLEEHWPAFAAEAEKN